VLFESLGEDFAELMPPNALNPSGYRFVGHLLVDAAIFAVSALFFQQIGSFDKNVQARSSGRLTAGQSTTRLVERRHRLQRAISSRTGRRYTTKNLGTRISKITLETIGVEIRCLRARLADFPSRPEQCGDRAQFRDQE
jgi:hypothetical protein